ncbi:hypothetical protein ACHAWF_004030, partial [Thalassiosira exigua]
RSASPTGAADAVVAPRPPSPLASGPTSWLAGGEGSHLSHRPDRLKLASSSSSDLPSQLLAEAEGGSTDRPPSSSSWADIIAQSNRRRTDRVKRVVDASTIQLEKGGLASLASVRGAGSTYQLPECMTYAPSYKLKQLLPKGTAVRLVELSDRAQQSSKNPRVWIVREKDDMLVNRELVRTGFAFVRKGAGDAPPEMADELTELERMAKREGLGIYRTCDDGNERAGDGSLRSFVAEFEPLDYDTEIRYGDDDGKATIVSRKETAPSSPPPNPGDVKGCSDFGSYEDALGWYETYAPYYGDVARLDRDGDGVPCPGLPHTRDAGRYRMKVPTKSIESNR